MLSSALKYAELGFYVLPLVPRRKEPLTRHGFKDASRHLPRIIDWWTDTPDANLAVSCGASGLVVLDVDVREAEKGRPARAGDETLARLNKRGGLGQTPRVLTPGGGQHLYYRCPEWAMGKRLKGFLGDRMTGGIEVKHQGYVVLPPSLHPNGGVYAWDMGCHVLDTQILELPAWLLRMLLEPEAMVREKTPGDAGSSALGELFAKLGWLGVRLGDGRIAVRCPWVHLHTDGRGEGRDSSTVLFAPREDGGDGAFMCAHAHCRGRTFREVVIELRMAIRSMET